MGEARRRQAAGYGGARPNPRRLPISQNSAAIVAPPNMDRLADEVERAATRGEPAIYETLRTASEVVDGLVLQLGMKPACKPGCSACCYQPVGLHDVDEARALLHDIHATHGPEVLREVLERNQRVQALVMANKVHDPDAWFLHVTEPCPALGQDGKCLGYNGRPMSCRTHMNGDADGCYDDLKRGRRGETQYGSPSAIAFKPYRDAGDAVMDTYLSEVESRSCLTLTGAIEILAGLGLDYTPTPGRPMIDYFFMDVAVSALAARTRTDRPTDQTAPTAA